MLKPKEINDVQFSKALRGYDPDEVDKFLDRVVEDYSALIRENAELTTRIESMEHKLDEYKNAKDSLREARDKIYRMAQEVASKAKAEAAQTEREAKERAERIVIEAKRDCEAQRRLYERLQLEVTRFKAKAVALFKSEIEQLNALPDIQMDGKDELRIRADELSQEDVLSSPFVEEYKEKHRAPKEIDFGVPEEREQKPEKTVDLPPVDPSEDFALDYLSGGSKSGFLGITTVPVEVETAEEPEPIETEEEPKPIVESEPVAETETIVEVESVAEPEPIVEQETVEAMESVVEPEPVTEPEPVVEPQADEEPEPVEESAFRPPFTIRRITEESVSPQASAEETVENEGSAASTETIDVVDTVVEEPKKTITPPPEHPKFGELRFGTDYDLSQEDGGSSRGFGFFKRKNK